MKILIKEGIVKKMVNRVLGFDLTDHIEMITTWDELDYDGQKAFGEDRDAAFRWLVDTDGPMYLFQIKDNSYLAQYDGGENSWTIWYNKSYNNLTEDEFLDKLGIGFMGVKLQQVIDEFVEE
jgi:hypothetical protein